MFGITLQHTFLKNRRKKANNVNGITLQVNLRKVASNDVLWYQPSWPPLWYIELNGPPTRTKQVRMSTGSVENRIDPLSTSSVGLIDRGGLTHHRITLLFT